jgi:hypothetical protein
MKLVGTAQYAERQVANPVVRYYDLLRVVGQRIDEQRAARTSDSTPASAASGFIPAFELPALDDRWTRYFSATPMGVLELAEYRGHALALLDLMGNEWTRTTKSGASGTMVARAVHAIRTGGQPIVIITPTSGNKGTALRDAVARAVHLGLVEPHELRIVMVVPRPSAGKLRRGFLDDDPTFAAYNPVVVAGVTTGAEVKQFGADAVELAAGLAAEHGYRLWYSLDLDNYRFGDSMRAFVEAECAPSLPAAPARVHAHPVSSAFGLLGYELGLTVLDRAGAAHGLQPPARHPAFLLVQHLATPDMVLSLRHGSFGREGMPAYHRESDGGPYLQRDDPSFPYATDALDERIDATFYTATPATSTEINGIVARHGGTGIVVSRRECVDRYHEIRAVLAPWRELPADPAQLREWSLVMGMCGLLNAIDRGLLAPDAEVMLHGSGCFWDDLVPPRHPDAVTVASTPADLVGLINRSL